MKAITLWQPWASAMAKGLKLNETRGWPTNYRGLIAICAAKRKPTAKDISPELAFILWEVRERFLGYNANIQDLVENLPLGKVVCVVEIYDCVKTDDEAPICNDMEYALGNYSPGRFAWRTKNCKALDYPVSVVGRQGFFNLTNEESELVTNQIK